MKTVTLEPINETQDVRTNENLLNCLLAHKLDVLMACGAKGLCATCHVHITSGADRLTPRTDREARTLAVISGAEEDSRLACQCRVLGDGVVVRLPEGMYIERKEDLLSLLGRRAETNILHPITGVVLIAKGKIITRTRLEALHELNVQVSEIKNSG